MSVITVAFGNRFSQQDKASLYGLTGRLTFRGLIGGVAFHSGKEGDTASLLPAGEGPALYGIGIDRGRYHVIDGGDGTTLAEGRTLEEVVSVLVP